MSLILKKAIIVIINCKISDVVSLVWNARCLPEQRRNDEEIFVWMSPQNTQIIPENLPFIRVQSSVADGGDSEFDKNPPRPKQNNHSDKHLLETTSRTLARLFKCSHWLLELARALDSRKASMTRPLRQAEVGWNLEVRADNWLHFDRIY